MATSLLLLAAPAGLVLPRRQWPGPRQPPSPAGSPSAASPFDVAPFPVPDVSAAAAAHPTSLAAGKENVLEDYWGR